MRTVTIAKDYCISKAELLDNEAEIRTALLNDNYQIENADIITAKHEVFQGRVRICLTVFFLLTVLIALAVTGVHWVISKDSTPITVVWSISGFWVGMIVNYYFINGKNE